MVVPPGLAPFLSVEPGEGSFPDHLSRTSTVWIANSAAISLGKPIMTFVRSASIKVTHKLTAAADTGYCVQGPPRALEDDADSLNILSAISASALSCDRGIGRCPFLYQRGVFGVPE
jgi:hypothetical protein